MSLRERVPLEFAEGPEPEVAGQTLELSLPEVHQLVVDVPLSFPRKCFITLVTRKVAQLTNFVNTTFVLV